MRNSTPVATAALFLATLLPLHLSAHETSPAARAGAPAPSSPVAASPVPVDPARRVIVHRTAGCGCCLKWVAHLRVSGFEVEVRDHASLVALKSELGVPEAKQSCHTAQVGGYFVEGHVPAADIERLLADAPRARGLALPGMPAGSPGMEMPDGSVDPYAVELVDENGVGSVYAEHGAPAGK